MQRLHPWTLPPDMCSLVVISPPLPLSLSLCWEILVKPGGGGIWHQLHFCAHPILQEVIRIIESPTELQGSSKKKKDEDDGWASTDAGGANVCSPMLLFVGATCSRGQHTITALWMSSLEMDTSYSQFRTSEHHYCLLGFIVLKPGCAFDQEPVVFLN